MTRAPVVASYGMGTNSTAYLVEMVRRQEPVDLILAADTGGERPEVYQFAQVFNAWLLGNGYPGITVVKKGGRQETLEEDCLRKSMLPSLAYGFKGCSHKYKIEPQDKFVNHWAPARQCWSRGGKVVKLLGYDVDEMHRQGPAGDGKYTYRYPLREWGWGRQECVDAIRAAGLPLPGKSACFFCPATTKPEILELRKNHPALLERALRIEREAHAAGNLKTVSGLGRKLNWAGFIVETTMAEEQGKTPVLSGPDNPIACGCYDESDE